MKKLVIALMAFALVITLAGCGGGGGGGSSYHLDRGDDGKGLVNNGFENVKKAYDSINTELAKFNPSNDADGSNRTNAIMEYVSQNYGSSNTNMRAAVDVSTYSKLKARFLDLIKRYKFEGLQIIAYGTKDGAVKDKEVLEKTKLYISKATKTDGSNISVINREYVFESIKWVNEGTAEAPVWKIISGFDELGKSLKDLGY